MREGKTILFGGCARLDYIKGPPLYFTLFGSSTLPVHLSSIEGADRLLSEKLGTFLQPPILMTPKELKEEGLQATDFTKKLYKYIPNSEHNPLEGDIEEDYVENRENNFDEENDIPQENFSIDETDGDNYDNNIERGEEFIKDREAIARKRKEKLQKLIDEINSQRPLALPQLKEETIEFEEGGDDYEHAFTDFVFPGIGWISATGKSKGHPLVFRMQSFSTPFVRDSVMPFEATKDNRKKKGYKKHGKLSNYNYSPDEVLNK